jgi:hypothetical protein
LRPPRTAGGSSTPFGATVGKSCWWRTSAEDRPPSPPIKGTTRPTCQIDPGRPLACVLSDHACIVTQRVRQRKCDGPWTTATCKASVRFRTIGDPPTVPNHPAATGIRTGRAAAARLFAVAPAVSANAALRPEGASMRLPSNTPRGTWLPVGAVWAL